MGCSLNAVQAEAVLQALKQNYGVYAPKCFPKQGRYSDTDVTKYAGTEYYEDIVWQIKSDYPAKGVLTPIQQAIFYFTEDEYHASKDPRKPILILTRPCDINVQYVQAKTYAGNGGYTDLYYERIWEEVRFALMEHNGGNDACFCASIGTNKTDDYSLALKFSGRGAQTQVTGEALAPYFKGMPQTGYTPVFVKENELKIIAPELDDEVMRLALKSHPMWKELNDRCTSYDICTVVYSTHTCFTIRDVIYGDNPEVGEHRHVTTSCQTVDFDQMTGQWEFHSTAGKRMCYEMLHEFHDYKARFDEGYMRVGCSRCTHRCPELTSISTTVSKVDAAVNEIKAGLAQQ